MKPTKSLMFVCLIVLLLALAGCSSGPSEKDVIGKWDNTKNPAIWMEFFPDMTSTGGKWSITKDGQIKIVNADGTVLTGTLKDGNLIFAEFGELGIFVKEGNKK
jgi:hypothetical protein